VQRRVLCYALGIISLIFKNMADEEKKEKSRAWIGKYEVGGSGAYSVVSGQYEKPDNLKLGNEYLSLERDKYGVTKIGGRTVKRDASKRIVALVDEQGNEEKVEGDLGAHID
jgi:hypothetical protein